MISIILYEASLNRTEEQISEFFELNGNRLIFTVIPLDSKSIAYSSAPFTFYMSIRDISDMQRLYDICTKYNDAQIIIEETSELNDLIGQLQGNTLGIHPEMFEQFLTDFFSQVGNRKSL